MSGVKCGYCEKAAVASVAGLPDSPGSPYVQVNVCAAHGRARVKLLAELMAAPPPPQPWRGWVRATELRAGDVMLLPFGKSATITEAKVGRVYVNLLLAEYPRTRVSIADKVHVERQVRS